MFPFLGNELNSGPPDRAIIYLEPKKPELAERGIFRSPCPLRCQRSPGTFALGVTQPCDAEHLHITASLCVCRPQCALREADALLGLTCASRRLSAPFLPCNFDSATTARSTDHAKFLLAQLPSSLLNHKLAAGLDYSSPSRPTPTCGALQSVAISGAIIPTSSFEGRRRGTPPRLPIVWTDMQLVGARALRVVPSEALRLRRRLRSLRRDRHPTTLSAAGEVASRD